MRLRAEILARGVDLRELLTEGRLEPTLPSGVGFVTGRERVEIVDPRGSYGRSDLGEIMLRISRVLVEACIERFLRDHSLIVSRRGGSVLVFGYSLGSAGFSGFSITVSVEDLEEQECTRVIRKLIDELPCVHLESVARSIEHELGLPRGSVGFCLRERAALCFRFVPFACNLGVAILHLEEILQPLSSESVEIASLSRLLKLIEKRVRFHVESLEILGVRREISLLSSHLADNPEVLETLEEIRKTLLRALTGIGGIPAILLCVDPHCSSIPLGSHGVKEIASRIGSGEPLHLVVATVSDDPGHGLEVRVAVPLFRVWPRIERIEKSREDGRGDSSSLEPKRLLA